MNDHDFNLTISPELENKFSGGISFIEDIAEDRYNLSLTFVRNTEFGFLYKITGAPAMIADFVDYLFS